MHRKNDKTDVCSVSRSLKSAGPKTQEQARLQVEEAEDKLVQTTETAIGLMKAVLENPEPIQNLNSLVKAQLIFHSTAAETLSVSVWRARRQAQTNLMLQCLNRTSKARSRSWLRRQSPNTVRRGQHDMVSNKGQDVSSRRIVMRISLGS